MDRYLIENYGPNPDMRDYGIRWLVEQGGGDIVTVLKSVMKNSFDIHTDGQYKDLERHLARENVRLATQRGGYTPQANVFALYPDKKLIDELEESKRIDKLLVLGWTEQDYKQWRDDHEVILIEGGRTNPV